jgi:hypothetical protein
MYGTFARSPRRRRGGRAFGDQRAADVGKRPDFWHPSEALGIQAPYEEGEFVVRAFGSRERVMFVEGLIRSPPNSEAKPCCKDAHVYRFNDAAEFT